VSLRRGWRDSNPAIVRSADVVPDVSASRNVWTRDAPVSIVDDNAVYHSQRCRSTYWAASLPQIDKGYCRRDYVIGVH
jgi:hypothetical protein